MPRHFRARLPTASGVYPSCCERHGLPLAARVCCGCGALGERIDRLELARLSFAWDVVGRRSWLVRSREANCHVFRAGASFPTGNLDPSADCGARARVFDAQRKLGRPAGTAIRGWDRAPRWCLVALIELNGSAAGGCSRVWMVLHVRAMATGGWMGRLQGIDAQGARTSLPWYCRFSGIAGTLAV